MQKCYLKLLNLIICQTCFTPTSKNKRPRVSCFTSSSEIGYVFYPNIGRGGRGELRRRQDERHIAGMRKAGVQEQLQYCPACARSVKCKSMFTLRNYQSGCGPPDTCAVWYRARFCPRRGSGRICGRWKISPPLSPGQAHRQQTNYDARKSLLRCGCRHPL